VDKKKALLKLFINPFMNYAQSVLMPININTPTEFIVGAVLLKTGLTPKLIFLVLLFI